MLELRAGKDLATTDFGGYNAETVSELTVNAVEILQAELIKFPSGDTMER